MQFDTFDVNHCMATQSLQAVAITARVSFASMGWSLGHLPIREPERLDSFFLAVGKALYLSSGYEAKCRAILRLGRLTDALKGGHDLDAALAICAAIKDKMLCATLGEIRKLPFGTNVEDAETLERAKDARNFIAHEAARLGHLSTVTASALESRTAALREAVSALAIGDNLISRWLYEIEEREHAPLTIRREYPNWIDNWVFGPS